MATIVLPMLPSPRELRQRRIADHQAAANYLHAAAFPQTLIYLGCRRWFRAAVVSPDLRYARRLTVAERVRLEVLRRLGAA